jgi:hypothetical protein
MSFLPLFFTDFAHYVNVNFEVTPIIGLVLSSGAYYIYSFGDLLVPRNLLRYFYVYSGQTAECRVINETVLTVVLSPIHELPFVSTFELLAARSGGLNNLGQYVHWLEMIYRWLEIDEEQFSNENKLRLL